VTLEELGTSLWNGEEGKSQNRRTGRKVLRFPNSARHPGKEKENPVDNGCWVVRGICTSCVNKSLPKEWSAKRADEGRSDDGERKNKAVVKY
jgi:hypothetical protein